MARSEGRFIVPPLPLPRIVVRDDNVFLDGRPVPLDITAERRPDALRFLAALSSEWQSRPDISKKEPELNNIRLDRLRKTLPNTLQEVIQTNRRKGYRIAPGIDGP